MKRPALARLTSFALVASFATALTGVAASGCSPAASRSTPTTTTGDASTPDDTSTGTPDGFTFDSSALEVPPSTTSDAPGEACAATSETAKLIPLDIFMMLDQSGSMADSAATGTKWDGVTAAISAFISSPAADGIGVGLQYFGLPVTPGDPLSDDSCKVADYATADVEIATLPGVKSAIETSLAAHSPSTGTPTGPALRGAILYAQRWQKKYPTHLVVVLLATDGDPNGCSDDAIDIISGYAATAAAGTPSMRTYVIGVVSADDLAVGLDGNLNQISRAGNGADAFIVKSSTDDVATAFSTALTKIRGAALSCQYIVPTGVGTDYNKVNVSVTSAAGVSSIIPYVGSAAKCDPTTGGWYYDVDPAVTAPTKILICDSSCKSLSAGSSSKIDIQVGCATEGPGLH